MSKNDQENKPRLVELVKALDLTAASPLAEAIGEARGHALTLNASKVERLGAQCLQVLLSASKIWEAEGFPFHVTDASPTFLDGMTTLGFSPDTFSQTEST